MVRLGLIGYGSWGANLARNIANVAGGPDFICDHSPQRLAAAQAAFPHAHITSAWPDCLARPVDGIVIASPSHQHFSMAREALSAGKHVFIEKPFALSTDQAEIVITQSSMRGLTLMVDHTYLFSPAIQTAARLIGDGAIGRPIRFTSERLNTAGVRHDAPVHWDLAAHDLAILDYLFPDVPDSISATFRSGSHAVELSLHFSTGFDAQVSVSWVADAKRRILEIEGTLGTIRIDDLRTHQKLCLTEKATDSRSFPELDSTEPLRAAVQHFVDCIEHNLRPISCGASALRGVRLLAAADQSLENKGMAVAVERRVTAA